MTSVLSQSKTLHIVDVMLRVQEESRLVIGTLLLQTSTTHMTYSYNNQITQIFRAAESSQT